MTGKCHGSPRRPEPGATPRRESLSTWLLQTALAAVSVYGCAVDDRSLSARPGLVFLTGGGGDMSLAGAGSGGGGSEAGQPEGGQSGAPTGDLDGGAGAASTGGSEDGGQPGNTGGSGTPAGSGGTLGGAGSSTAAGASAGFGGAGGHLVGRCPDLDDDWVLDCDETIAKNYGFDRDASDWATETNIVLGWSTPDGEGHSGSGSLSIEDTFTSDMDSSLMLGARQCIPVSEKTTYVFGVQISVPDAAPNTTAGLQLIVYNEDDCQGSMVDVATSVLTSGSTWSGVTLEHPMPKFAKSLVLRLVTLKPFREAPVSVLFDNVLVHPKSQ